MFRYCCNIVALAGLLLVSPQAWSLVNDFPPTVPSTKNIAVGKSTSVSLIWRVTDNAFASGSVTITSSGGQLCVGTVFTCTTLKANSVTLSRTYTATAGQSRTFAIPESVVVPQSIIEQARKMGFNTLLYRRTWSPGGTFPTGAITLNITGSSAAGFSVNTQAMRFDDESIVKLLNEKEPLKAKAELKYTGSGQVRAFWEVAGPSTGSGLPIFRTLIQVRKYLVAGDKTTFVSPLLPTSTAGAYMVRMRITSPAPGFDTPVIRYFVGARGATIAPPLPMSIGGPSDRVWLARDTQFRWQPIKSAKNYRLEFYDKPKETDVASSLPNLGDQQTSKKPIRLQGSPVAGVMLPGDVTQVIMPISARNKLVPGRWYYWRIVAFGVNGKIVGLSPIREVRVP